LTQHCEKVDKNFRRNTQEYILMRNCGNERFFNLPIVGGVRFGKVLRSEHYLEPPSPGQRPFETHTLRLRVDEIGKHYDTSAGVGLAGGIHTEEQVKGGHWSKLVLFVVLALCVLAAIPWGVGKGVKLAVGAVMGAGGAVGTKVAGVSGLAHVHPLTVGELRGPVPAVGSPVGGAVAAPPVPAVVLPSEPDGQYLTAITPVGVWCTDGGQYLNRDGYHFDLVRGGVFVQGVGFIGWPTKKQEAARSPDVAVGVHARPVRQR
jgi:hypothetical protein